MEEKVLAEISLEEECQNYKDVLIGMEFVNIDGIGRYPKGMALDLGIIAKNTMKSVIEQNHDYECIIELQKRTIKDDEKIFNIIKILTNEALHIDEGNYTAYLFKIEQILEDNM